MPDDLWGCSWIDVAGTGITSLPPRFKNTQIRWRGVPIDARIAFQPETLTEAEILAEKNPDRRRVMQERFEARKM